MYLIVVFNNHQLKKFHSDLQFKLKSFKLSGHIPGFA